MHINYYKVNKYCENEYNGITVAMLNTEEYTHIICSTYLEPLTFVTFTNKSIAVRTVVFCILE